MNVDYEVNSPETSMMRDFVQELDALYVHLYPDKRESLYDATYRIESDF